MNLQLQPAVEAAAQGFARRALRGGLRSEEVHGRGAGRRTLILLRAGRRCQARIDEKHLSSASPACSVWKCAAGTNRSQLAQ